MKAHQYVDSLIGRAIRKYGWENFIVVILAECKTKDEADTLEIFWIEKLNCKAPNGYNLTDGGDGSLGCSPSEETRRKLSEFGKLRYSDPKERQKDSEALKKYYENPEAHKKTSETTKKALNKPEILKKLSEATKKRFEDPNARIRHGEIMRENYRKHPEIKDKLSAASKGKPQTPEAIASRAAALIGHPVPAETRKKISDALKAYNQKKRDNQKS